MKNLAKYISIGLMASLTSCKTCDSGYKPPSKKVELCTNDIKLNFKEATYELYALSGDQFRELKGTVTFDTTDALTGTYTSTYSDLGTSGTYTKDCRLSRLTFKGTYGEVVWNTDVHETVMGKYYYLSNGCQVTVPQGGLLTGESKYSLEIIK